MNIIIIIFIMIITAIESSSIASKDKCFEKFVVMYDRCESDDKMCSDTGLENSDIES